ncbi:hypothetical protein OSB04_003409 [Centaurea solstitialis]|uniref:Uncharacterized protein n=1 Tax=Centaurea solstitialis TaxID=347529 RepID=A0AA38UCH8_9ASTR|nr:hypothetical protein OSB04_003409 [Centaurea solstitialis]
MNNINPVAIWRSRSPRSGAAKFDKDEDQVQIYTHRRTDKGTNRERGSDRVEVPSGADTLRVSIFDHPLLYCRSPTWDQQVVSEQIQALIFFLEKSCDPLSSYSMALQAKDNYFDTGSAGKPPRFNKDNFSLWKTRMELFLSGSDPQIPYFLENGPHIATQTVHPIPAAAGQPAVPERQLVKPVTDWNDEDRRLVNIDTKARSLIAMSLPDDVFHSVCHLRSAKEIWDTLCV